MAKLLKYTNLTYDQIIEAINNKLNADPRFDQYRNSSIVSTLTEVFAGCTDLILYYLEQRASECYFDSAQLRSSVILLSRLLGYIVQRPIPASATLKFKLKGNFTDKGLTAGTRLQIPFHSSFTYEGFSYILKKTLTVTITQAMINSMTSNGEGYESEFILIDNNGDDIGIAQGEIKEKVIEGSNNPQIAQKFQLYKIDDTEFSNIYGEEDFTPPTSRVWVGDTKTANNEYSVDRRSLVNWQKFSQTEAADNKLCVIRSAVTEDVELLFGDARYTAIGANVSGTGANTVYDNIYIQYLATKGYKGNKVGVTGKKINFGGQIYIENGVGQSFDITNQVEFYFKSNLVGGADMEDIDSIRVNAPNVYYSLDRLVTAKDYISYLKTLTSPIIIKNAYTIGEQEECLANDVQSISKLFNVVLYTCIGEMYDLSESPYYARTKDNGLDQTVLDNDFDENEIAERNYYNVYTFQEVVKQLKEYEVSAYFYKVNGIAISDSMTTTELYNYGTSQDIIVRYKSPELTTEATKTITVAITPSLTTIPLYCNDFINKLQTELRDSGFVDEREESTTYNLPAFENAVVSYDSTEKKISIKIDPTSNNCYIAGLSASDDSYLQAIGFSNTIGSSISYENGTVMLSDKILDVTNKLKDRSMLSVQNIYISPIIHNFNISGKVYINQMSDRETLRVNIANDIYTWLNTNADFNKPIYKSNIIDIINSYSDVKYCNVLFEPQTLSATSTSTFYNNGNNKYLNSNLITQPTAYSYAQYIINIELNNFLSAGTKTDPNQDNINISVLNNNVQVYSYQWNSFINERNFFTSFVKNVYDTMLDSGYNQIVDWAKSSYFLKEMSLIHKDLLKIIRWNMLDSSGNLAPEYDSTETLIKGGYSLLSEIAKMNVNLVYEYAS